MFNENELEMIHYALTAHFVSWNKLEHLGGDEGTYLFSVEGLMNKVEKLKNS
jgi:hypothetical protein